MARHRNATPELLEQLAGDDDRQVRAAVAAHPSTPLAALTRLAADENSYVQMAVVRSARVEALEAVPADTDEAVQTALTQRHRLEQRSKLHDRECPPETVAAAADPGQSYEMRALGSCTSERARRRAVTPAQRPDQSHCPLRGCVQPDLPAGSCNRRRGA